MYLNELKSSLNFSVLESKLSEDLKLVSGIPEEFNIDLNGQQLKDWVDSYNSYSCPTIACGILTYNEENRIKRCLQSVMNEFDEIIVLDSLSSDQTVELIKENYPKVKVITEKWRDDFSFHRNLLRSSTNSEWIYYIDSDNTYDPTNEGKIHRIVRLLSYIGFNGVVSPVIKEHDGHVYTDNRKLFPINSGIRYFGRVHEEPLLENGQSPIHATMDILVHHDGYDPLKVNMNDKTNRNLRLTQMMLEDEPGHPKWLYFLAKEVYHTQNNLNIEEVKSILIEAIRRYESSEYKRYLPEAILFLCDLSIRTNSYSQLSKYVDLLEQISPNCVDVDYYRAVLVLQDITVRTAKLANYVKESLQDNTKYSYINSTKDHIRLMLTNIMWLMNNWDEANKINHEIRSEDKKIIFSNMLNEINDWLSTLKEEER
ncbi:SunS family peptide S-glycosyltransferase [Paenibacillus amylolyticus]|uniref:SunS family peptide S-glycosyltransferase n=1 Tax=Paenibacillus amylolyticus TaxID=1451 RepID=A0A5M9WY89_PAEAM|nr:SunS family peptide S-glycosyltransferase [Paenibacillus amylolyticus]KAA8786657.1 SunS family peptide S-glycosyltransferase [Paenibacillus amylolyticus]